MRGPNGMPPHITQARKFVVFVSVVNPRDPNAESKPGTIKPENEPASPQAVR